jgi:hypothetical protein
MKKYIYGLTTAILLGALAFYGLSAATAAGVVSFFVTNPSIQTATTTASVNHFMTPGTGTTTIVLANPNSEANPYRDVSDSYLFMNWKASTTQAAYWYYEWANGNGAVNCETTPANCDWYGEDKLGTTYTVGVPTIEHSSTTPIHYMQTVASSTKRAIKVPFNAANYARVVFYVPIGGSNGTIFLQDNSVKSSY